MDIITLLRQYRVGPFAIFDFAISYLAFFIFSPLIIRLFSYFGIRIGLSNIMWMVLPLSILTHIVIGKYTPLTKMFLDPSGNYLIKFAILFMVYMGIRS